MSKKAFSLMEIIVVIIILGALAGLAFPQYLKSMELRKVDVVKQQMKQIATALDIIETSNKDYVICLGGTPVGVCLMNDDINSQLELDIHNSDFRFEILDGGVNGWYIFADRQNSSKQYKIFYEEALDDFSCDDAAYGYPVGACDWINMPW